MQADDPELDAIRQRRMAQLMAQQGGGQNMPASEEEMQQQAQQQQAAEDQRRAMLVAVMQPSARERCTFSFYNLPPYISSYY